MARDLHDEALQELSGAMAYVQPCGHDTRRRIFAWSKLSTALKRTEQRVRSAVYDLGLEGDRNKVFTELLENLIEIHSEMAHEIEISLETEGADFSEALGRMGTELLRIIGEALTNARRHSGARNVRISDGTLRAEVRDD
jgi:signal transduction histidine kinase